MKIYLDVFFLLNMGMNFVILLIESFFGHRMISIRRLFFSSAVGAGIACVMIVSGIHRLLPLLILAYFLTSILLIRIAFGKTTGGALVRNIWMFYVIAFVLAGLLVQLQKVFGLPMTGTTVLLVAALVLLILRALLPRLQRRQEQLERYYRIRLHYEGRCAEGNALLDTGNHLCDPFTRKPVLLGDAGFLAKVLQKEKEPLMRMIPFHSVGKENGFLPTFRADLLEVENQGIWQPIEKPWVAVCDKYVSADGEYDVILHPDMLIKSDVSEDLG